MKSILIARRTPKDDETRFLAQCNETLGEKSLDDALYNFVRSSLLALDVSDPLAVDVSTEKVQTTTSYYDMERPK